MKKTTVTIPILPEHLIVEQILPRLPVKSLIRFKSVSKYWLSTICSHDFQQLQLRFSSSCPQAIILECDYLLHPSYLLSFDNCNNVKKCVELKDDYTVSNLPDNRYGPPYSCEVVSSCNGLVCLYYPQTCFFLWNPATNQSQKVNVPDYYYHTCNILFRGMGFGYVSSIDDYRIVLMLYNKGNSPNVHVYIFSWRARDWITMAIADFNFFCGESMYVVVDDTLYFPLKILPRRIAGLNLVSGQVKEFPLLKFLDYFS